jgi:hypothetical protein
MPVAFLGAGFQIVDMPVAYPDGAAGPALEFVIMVLIKVGAKLNFVDMVVIADEDGFPGHGGKAVVMRIFLWLGNHNAALHLVHVGLLLGRALGFPVAVLFGLFLRGTAAGVPVALLFFILGLIDLGIPIGMITVALLLFILDLRIPVGMIPVALFFFILRFAFTSAGIFFPIHNALSFFICDTAKIRADEIGAIPGGRAARPETAPISYICFGSAR